MRFRKWLAEKFSENINMGFSINQKNISPEYPEKFVNLFGSLSDETFKRPEQPFLSDDA